MVLLILKSQILFILHNILQVYTHSLLYSTFLCILLLSILATVKSMMREEIKMAEWEDVELTSHCEHIKNMPTCETSLTGN